MRFKHSQWMKGLAITLTWLQVLCYGEVAIAATRIAEVTLGIATGLALPISNFGERREAYILADNGSVYAIGNPTPPLYGPTEGLHTIPLSDPGVTPAVDLEVVPSNLGYLILTANGDIFAFGVHQLDYSALAGRDGPLWPGDPSLHAVDLEFSPDFRSYYILSSDGSVLQFNDNGTSAELVASIWPGQDRARDMEVSPTGLGFYVVDDLGNVTAFGDAEDLSATAGPNQDGNLWPISADARDMGVTNDGNSYYIVNDQGETFFFSLFADDTTILTPAFEVFRDFVFSYREDEYYLVDQAGTIYPSSGDIYNFTLSETIEFAQASDFEVLRYNDSELSLVRLLPDVVVAQSISGVNIFSLNNGTSVWTTPRGHRLGEIVRGPNSINLFSISEIFLSDNEIVLPDDSFDFEFTVGAPGLAGRYTYQWSMTQNAQTVQGDLFGGSVAQVVDVLDSALPYPDLEVLSEDILFSQDSPPSLEVVILRAQVKNISHGNGLAASNISVAFYDGNPSKGGQRIDIVNIPFVDVNGMELSPAVLWIYPGGKHDIYVELDSNHAIVERHEINNVAFRTIPDPNLRVIIDDFQDFDSGLNALGLWTGFGGSAIDSQDTPALGSPDRYHAVRWSGDDAEWATVVELALTDGISGLVNYDYLALDIWGDALTDPIIITLVDNTNSGEKRFSYLLNTVAQDRLLPDAKKRIPVAEFFDPDTREGLSVTEAFDIDLVRFQFPANAQPLTVNYDNVNLINDRALPDLAVTSEEINMDDLIGVVNGTPVNIFVKVRNITESDHTQEFDVRFFKEDPLNGGTEIGSVHVTTPLSSAVPVDVNLNWNYDETLIDLFVVVETPSEEITSVNNQAVKRNPNKLPDLVVDDFEIWRNGNNNLNYWRGGGANTQTGVFSWMIINEPYDFNRFYQTEWGNNSGAWFVELLWAGEGAGGAELDVTGYDHLSLALATDVPGVDLEVVLVDASGANPPGGAFSVVLTNIATDWVVYDIPLNQFTNSNATSVEPPIIEGGADEIGSAFDPNLPVAVPVVSNADGDDLIDIEILVSDLDRAYFNTVGGEEFVVYWVYMYKAPDQTNGPWARDNAQVVAGEEGVGNQFIGGWIDQGGGDFLVFGLPLPSDSNPVTQLTVPSGYGTGRFFVGAKTHVGSWAFATGSDDPNNDGVLTPDVAAIFDIQEFHSIVDPSTLREIKFLLPFRTGTDIIGIDNIQFLDLLP